jgi:hypothetical protein
MARLLLEVSYLGLCAYLLAGCAGDFDAEEGDDEEPVQRGLPTVSAPADEFSEDPARNLPRPTRGESPLKEPVPAPFTPTPEPSLPPASPRVPDPPDPLLGGRSERAASPKSAEQ